MACRDRTRGNGFKLKKTRFRLKKKFFIVRVRVTETWTQTSRETELFIQRNKLVLFTF